MSFVQDTLTITKKEIKLFVKQPLFGVARSLLFPIIWIVFFAYGFGGTLHSIPIAVVKEGSGAYSQQLVDGLATGDTFSIKFSQYENSLKDFQAKKYSAVVYIPKDFDDSVKNNAAKVYLTLDSTNPTLASAIKSRLESTAQGMSRNIIIAKTGDSIVDPITVEEETFYGRGIRYLDFLSPGIIIQTIVFSAMFSGGVSLLMDKEFGTLKLLMLAPISRASIILGKTLGGAIEALISGFITLIIVILLGIKVKYDIMLVVFVPLIMTLVAFGFIGMSTVIATKVKRLEQFIMMTQTIILPLWFVSGAIYPLDSMPNWMQVIAKINPLTYAVDALRSIMIRGAIIESIIPDVLILISFSTIMFLIGVLSFRRTIE